MDRLFTLTIVTAMKALASVGLHKPRSRGTWLPGGPVLPLAACSFVCIHSFIPTLPSSPSSITTTMSFFTRSFPSLNRLKQLAFRPRGVEEFFENGKSIPTEKSWTGTDPSRLHAPMHLSLPPQPFEMPPFPGMQ